MDEVPSTPKLHRVWSPRIWLGPLLAAAVVLSAIAAVYMGGILKPQDNLRHFPVALVNADQGVTVAGQPVNYGDQVEHGFIEAADPEEVDFKRVSLDEANMLLDRGEVYGAVVIPDAFSADLVGYGASATASTKPNRPTITVVTNPRASTFASSMVSSIATPAIAQASKEIGTQLTAQVSAQGPEMSGLAQDAFAAPIATASTVHNPLPDGTGNGLSAFYYALLLLLGGFTGAVIVHTLIDGRLGFVPTEFGPFYRQGGSDYVARLPTLFMKWATIALVAPILSALYIAITDLLGMPNPRPVALWAYGTLAILAIGVTALSIMAAIGNAGMLVNMFIFVILGLPSAGATIPVEATPRLYGWLSEFEPMRQVFVGARALLYYEGTDDVTHGVWKAVLGLVIGLVLGLVVTSLYDRRGHRRENENTAAA